MSEFIDLKKCDLTLEQNLEIEKLKRSIGGYNRQNIEELIITMFTSYLFKDNIIKELIRKDSERSFH